MNVLKELMETAIRRSSTPADPTLSLNDIDTFAAEHPHIVDLDTELCGEWCVAWERRVLVDSHAETIRSTPWCNTQHPRRAAPTGEPCPVLAARKERDDG